MKDLKQYRRLLGAAQDLIICENELAGARKRNTKPKEMRILVSMKEKQLDILQTMAYDSRLEITVIENAEATK